jgi:hypothetical protein
MSVHECPSMNVQQHRHEFHEAALSHQNIPTYTSQDIHKDWSKEGRDARVRRHRLIKSDTALNIYMNAKRCDSQREREREREREMQGEQ